VDEIVSQPSTSVLSPTNASYTNQSKANILKTPVMASKTNVKVKNGRKRLFRKGEVMSVQVLERTEATVNKRQETRMQDKKQANSI